MNDWEIRKLLTTVFALQAVVWCFVALNSYGIPMSILQALFTLVYLILLPGVLILRVFHVHELGEVTSLLYSVGLSITNVMVVGLFLNTMLPAVGFMTPISLVPLLITFSLEICILSAACYKFDKYVPKTESDNLLKDLVSPQFLLLCLIPFFSIFSTRLMNDANNPVLQLLLIIIIAALTIFIGFRSSFQERLYPFSIFVIALSLVYSVTLISRFLTGAGDIYQEYYVANLVMQRSIWDSTLNLQMNASAAITMLAPILSIFSGVSLTWIFKVVYPFLFSLVPVCLYQIFKKLTTPKIAFFSAILFVFTFPFYVDLLTLARQQIGELFLALLVLTIVSARTTRSNKSLALIFAASIIISHYALAFLYIAVLVFVWLVVSVSEVSWLRERIRRVLGTLPSQRKQHSLTSKKERNYGSVISLPFVLVFAVCTMAWFIYTARSLILVNVVNAASVIIVQLQTDFLAPQSTEGLQVLSATPVGLLHQIAQDIRLIQQLLILIGAAALTLRFVTLKFTKEYMGLIWINIVFLAAAVIVPSFASQIYVVRLYHIILMFTAPCCVIGVLALLKASNYYTKRSITQYLNALPRIFAVFLVVFLLFETGFVYQVVDHQSWSIAFGSTYEPLTHNSAEEAGAQWIQRVRTTGYLFGDLAIGSMVGQFGSGTEALGQPAGAPSKSFSVGTGNRVSNSFYVDISRIPADSTIVLGTYNIVRNEISVKTRGSSQYVTSNLVIDNRSRIFDGGGIQIYRG